MMGGARIRAETLALLLAHIGRIGDTAHLCHGLTATQWHALRYFADANAMSRTVSALARYCATTRGPASKTVKTLIDAGYLIRRPAQHDGRSSRLDLTDSGRGLIAHDPFRQLVTAITTLPDAERRGLEGAADRLLAGLACGDGGFGTCHSCAHMHPAANDDGPICAVTGVVLTPSDQDCICAAYTPRTRPSDGSG